MKAFVDDQRFSPSKEVDTEVVATVFFSTANLNYQPVVPLSWQLHKIHMAVLGAEVQNSGHSRLGSIPADHLKGEEGAKD